MRALIPLLSLLAGCDLLDLTTDPVPPPLPDWSSCEWACTHDPEFQHESEFTACDDRCEQARVRCPVAWNAHAECLFGMYIGVIFAEGCLPDRNALAACLGDQP